MGEYSGIGPLKTARDAYYWNRQEIAQLELFAHQIAEVNRMDITAYRAFVKSYKSASIVLWLDDIRMAAISGYKHFMGHSLSEDSLNPRVQLWITSTDIEINDQAALQQIGVPPGFTVGSQLVTISNSKLFSASLFLPSAGMQYSPSRTMRLPDEVVPRIRMNLSPLTADHEAMAKSFAMIEFMNLPLTQLAVERLDRPERRRMQKQNIPEPELRIITLRKRESESSSHNDPADRVDWSCRWIVGGHWRKQWYPSSQTHRPVFIVPYVKGPDDKPLKPDSGERVYVVAR